MTVEGSTISAPRVHNRDVYKNVPPEGGWGYFVCIGVVLVFVCCFSHMHSIGILYKDFLDEVGSGAQGLTTVTGVMSVMLSLAGVFSNVAMKKFSLRQVGWGAALAFSLGWLLNTQVTSVLQLTLTVGVIQGLAAGLLMPAALTNFNQYFVRRRMVFMSLTKVVTGLFNMAAPVLIEMSLRIFGFRSTMLLLAGVSANSLLGVTMMHPIKWHHKRIRINDQEDMLIQEQDKNDILRYHLTDISEDLIKENESAENGNSLNNDDRPIGDFPAEYNKDSPEDSSSEDVLDSNLMMTNQRTARAFSIISTGQGLVLTPPRKKTSKWKATMELFDFNLFKDPLYCNICFGLAMTSVTDGAFFMLLPSCLTDSNFTLSEVAWCISLVSATDLVSRGVIGVLGHFWNFTSMGLFYVGMCASFILRIVMFQVNGFLPTCLVVGALGFFRGFFVVPMMLIYAEHFPLKFTAAFGLTTLVTGFTSSILFPVIGLVKDMTGSFPLTFNILNSLSLLCIISWGIDLYRTRRAESAGKK